MEEHYLPIQPEFAETLTDNYLGKTSSYEILSKFDSYMSDIDKLGKKDLYQGICNKSEVPPQGIRKLAAKLADNVMPNQK